MSGDEKTAVKEPADRVVMKLADGKVVTQAELDKAGLTKSQWCFENAVSLYPDAHGRHTAYAGGRSRA